MDKVQEKKLVERAIAGETKAFERLVEGHLCQLKAFALTIAGNNSSLAEDILQEALVKAYMHITEFRGQASFSSWLWRIIRNELLMYHEKYTNREQQLDVDEPASALHHHTETAEDQYIEDELKENVKKMVSLLSPADQEVIVLIEFMDMSYDEAAAMLEISLSALKTRIMRARERLAEIMMQNMQLFI